MVAAVQTMAYVGETPWHGLGEKVDPSISIEEWKEKSGMNYKLLEQPVFTNVGGMKKIPGYKAIVRSDSGHHLSLMKDGYKLVQPGEVLDFFKDLTDKMGFQLETAGVLREGRKYWALANIGKEARIMGQDQLGGYLLLGTSCDGTMATTATFTSIRVVCQNTLSWAIQDAETNKETSRLIKIYHRSAFQPEQVKMQLGIGAASWENFIDRVNVMAQRKVKPSEAQQFLVNVFGDPLKDLEEQPNARAIKTVYELFNGQGRGSDFKSADGTAWGLVNAVTEFIDHKRGKNQDTRLDAAWFGYASNWKTAAWDEALKLAA